MEDAFFKTADRSFGFRFHGNPLDRASDRRDDAAFLAALRARPDARTLLIARDMPILARANRARRFFRARRSRRSAGRELEILLGLEPRGAPVFAALLPDEAVEQRADNSDGFLDRRELVVPGRDDLELIDLRSIALQGLVAPATIAMLGEAKAIARLARPPRILRQMRRAEPHRRRRLAARMRRLQGAAFPAHRSRRHHAGGRRRPLSARAAGALSQGHVFGARRFRRTRRDDRGGGPA